MLGRPRPRPQRADARIRRQEARRGPRADRGRRHVAAAIAVLLLSVASATSATSATSAAEEAVPATAAPRASIGDPPVLAMPAAGPVTALFGQAGRYGRGHTGVDIGLEPGTPVRAAAGGRISFAGAVAGRLSIAIDHGGGWSTTYSFLAELRVATGQPVGAGEPIATSGPGHPGGPPGLHFGLRAGDDYVDALRHLAGRAELLAPDLGGGRSRAARRPAVSQAINGRFELKPPPGVLPPRCVLLPVTCARPLADEASRWLAGAKRMAARIRDAGAAILMRAVDGVDWAARAAEGAAAWVSRQLERAEAAIVAATARGSELARRAARAIAGAAGALSPLLPARVRDWLSAVLGEAAGAIPRMVGRAAGFLPGGLRRAADDYGARARRAERASAFVRSQRDCREPGAAATPPGVAVLVGGFGSSLATGETAVSLDLNAAGLAASRIVSFSYAGHRPGGHGWPEPEPYAPADSWQDIERSAIRLGALVDAITAAGGSDIVLIGHSQGGVVARYFATEVYGQASRGEGLRRVITMGSPLRGSAGARSLAQARSSVAGERLAGAAGRLAEIDAGARSLEQMAEGSAMMRMLDAHSPPSVPLTSIAAAEDVIVPVPDTFLPWADHVEVHTGLAGRLAHSGMLRSPAAMAALRAALGGWVLCQRAADWLAADSRGEWVARTESALGRFVAAALAALG